MLEPYRGRVYDPCCGSSGMFVQSVEFIRAHANGNGNGGKAKADISIYGQESTYTTWRLAQMNLAIRGINAQIKHGDSFHADTHPDLKADFILANPPFNVSDWGGATLRDDKRWAYGAPPVGNANYAWVQHIVHHLAPAGVAGFVLANGSMASSQSGEGEIRTKLVEADLVDCMVAMPGQLFYSTQIPVCRWFLARDRRNGKFRDRRGQVLFIDARKRGRMADRTHRELTDDDIERIATAYHAWRGEKNAGDYADVAGFCKSATLEEVRKHGHALTPGRYVGAEAVEDDDELFMEKMARLAATPRGQQAEAAKLDAAITEKLLKGEVARRRRQNVVQARSFADMLEQTVRRYHNRAIEAAQLIEERIALAKEMREAKARGEARGLSDDELACHDALETNDSAVKVLGDAALRTIAQELVKTVRANVMIDWTVRENARANLRVLVKRILCRYGYPPDKQERATETVLEQAALLSSEWATV